MNPMINDREKTKENEDEEKSSLSLSLASILFEDTYIHTYTYVHDVKRDVDKERVIKDKILVIVSKSA